jgi:hypothetical protein
MKTPASVWSPSLRQYNPSPPRWEYPAGAWVLKVGSDGKIKAKGRNWKINKALAGEWVQAVRVENRVMVFYCATMVRELDLASQRSTIVERWLPQTPTLPPLQL